MLFEVFYERHLSLQHLNTRNTGSNLLPVRLDVERNLTILQRIQCFDVAPAQLCVPMSDYAFQMKYKTVCIRELWMLNFCFDNIFH